MDKMYEFSTIKTTATRFIYNFKLALNDMKENIFHCL